MLRERYETQDIFETLGTVGLGMEPVLQRLNGLLDDDVLFQAVLGDLGRRYPRTKTFGRGSTPVEVILRMLVVKHLYGWSDAQTEQWVNDSIVLRQFCRVYLERVPDDTTLLRWANVIQPATVQELLARVVELARDQQVTRGRKLRVDSTVVETNIHYPTDSTLLNDGVRVVSRTLQRANRVLKGALQRSRAWYEQQTQQARQTMLKIGEAARRRGEEAEAGLQGAYQDLVALTQALVTQAQLAQAQLQPQTDPAAQRLAHQLAGLVPRVQQIIDQTVRRVSNHEPVPAADKLVSVFEAHSAIIRKGKFQAPVEFGRVIWLDEVEGGIISRYAVLDGNPPDANQLAPSLDHHQQRFGRPPHLVTADRKVFSTAGEADALARGVKYVAIPKPGTRSLVRQAHERQAWFRSGRNWRAGIESRISLLKRRYGLKRCLNHGDAGMKRYVGWAIIAYDLHVIAQKLAA